MRSLAELYVAMRTSTGEDINGLMFFAQIATKAMLAVLSMPVLGLIVLQERLLARSSQRAEYYADHLSATVAGQRAAVSMLEKLRLARVAVSALGTAVIRRDEDIWAASRAWLAARTAEDQARLPAHEAATPHRSDASHPPTASRVAAVRTRAYGGDVLVSDRAEAARIDGELASVLPQVTRAIRDHAVS